MLTRFLPSVAREIEDSYLIPRQWNRNELRRRGFRGYVYNAVDLTSFNKLITNIFVQWDVNKSVANLANPINEAGQQTVSAAYAFGTTTGQFANQVARGKLTLGTSSTTHFNMSSLSIPNVVGTATPSFTKVKEILIELLAADQTDDLGNAGNACSSIVLGNDAGQKWAGPFGTTGLYTLNNGDKWHHCAYDAGGITVTAGDLLQIVNNDGANQALVRITIIGLA